MRRKEGRKHERLDGHELDKNVERRPGCVLQGITDGVTDNGRFVWVGSFRTKGSRMLGSSSLLYTRR